MLPAPVLVIVEGVGAGRRETAHLGLLIVPLLFGRGMPLFPLTDSPDQLSLDLVKQHAYPDGALELHYRPATSS